MHLGLDMDDLRMVGRSGCTEVEGVDDAAQLMHTLDAMEAVAMTQEEQTQVYRSTYAYTIRMCVFMYTHTHTHTLIPPPPLSLYIYTHIHIYVYIYVYVYTYTYIPKGR